MKKGRSCSSHTSQVEALFQSFGKLVFIVYKVIVTRVPEAHTDSARAAIAVDIDLLVLKAFAQTVRILSRDPVFQICFLFCRQLACRFYGNATVQLTAPPFEIPSSGTELCHDSVVAVKICRHILAVIPVVDPECLTDFFFIAGSKATVVFFGIIVVVTPAVRRVQVHGERKIVFLSDRGNGSGIDGFAKVIEMLRLLICDPIHDTELLFISFEDIKKDPALLDELDVIINVGDADTAHTGGIWWEDPEISSAIRKFVWNGGGFIGVGEPSGHAYQGHILQLASVLGVEEENGFTLNYDKYNWDEHPDHFILQDADQPIDFGEGKKNIYALEGTEVLVQRNREVQMAAHDFGKGRAVYISGVPYSFANSRTLYRAILWSAHSEEELHTWFSSNYNVEVHAYVKNGKYCVVNNTYEPQDTTVYTTDGNHFDLHLEANEIKWYEI